MSLRIELPSRGIRVTEEQELHMVRRRLTDFPEAMKAVIQAAHALRRPVSEVSVNDVEFWVSAPRDEQRVVQGIFRNRAPRYATLNVSRGIAPPI